MPESIRAAAEQGVDISGHVARRAHARHRRRGRPVLCMAREHRDAVAAGSGRAAETFTLKELVRLLEALPHQPPDAAGRPRRAIAGRRARRRAGFAGNPMDEDVADPLGMPIETYRAMAWELEGWTTRLAEAIAGPRPRSRAAGVPVRIALGADHAGFALKEHLKGYLAAEGHEVTDHGTTRPIRSTTRRSVPPRRGRSPPARPTAPSSWAAPVRASRSWRTRSTASGRRSATTCTWRAFARAQRRERAGDGGQGDRGRLRQEIIRVWLATEFQGGRHR